MRNHLLTLTLCLALIGLVPTACSDSASLVAPDQETAMAESATAELAQMNSKDSETVELDPMKDGVEGTSTLMRRANGFTFRLSDSGLSPGHPVTLWALDTDTGDLGFAAGGIVGGAGAVNIAGNNWINEGGKSPGDKPDCNLIDPMANIEFHLLEGESQWDPGHMDVRWNPAEKPPAAVAEHRAED